MYLGWIVNGDKSDLDPSQFPKFIGVLFDFTVGLAWPAYHWIETLLKILAMWKGKSLLPAKDWQVMLSHQVSLEKSIPRGRLHLRPVQEALRAS